MRYLKHKTLALVVLAGFIIGSCTPSHRELQYDSENILVNQIGYQTTGSKTGLSKTAASDFRLVDENGEVVFEGKAGEARYWNLSGDRVSPLDFSAFDIEGRYRLCAGGECSPKFSIGTQLYRPLADAALKSYYYARCSQEIPPEYGGQWTRKAGHPDTEVLVHSSAADANRPEGTTIASPGGWYDAGDYGKYIVNSSITTWTLLKSLEANGEAHRNQGLTIPESGNDLPDILDETLVNLRWMMTMQDPNDGGVYHKLTTKGFDDFILPEQTDKPRYVIQKSTAAALDFTATLAFGSRIVGTYGNPELAGEMKTAALKAWEWSLENPDTFYEQPEDISTGAYPDTTLTDERFWAASELYLTTGEERFKTALEQSYVKPVTPKWDVVQALGAISLITSDQKDAFGEIRTDFIDYAEDMLARQSTSPYLISMKEFAWGSNSDVGNDGMLKVIAYDLTGDERYLKAAQNDLDYLLGRNTTGYCFVTGFGSQSPLEPHNRIMAADGIEAPIPGYIAGGPNTIVLNDCEPEIVDRSTFPAASYADVQCSYSTNETAINWNAPLVFLTSGLLRTEGQD
jgi:endoglucanase